VLASTIRAGVAVGLIAAGGFAAATFALSPAPAAGTAKRRAVTTVTVTATEFKFKLSRKTVPAGLVVFHVVNRGRIKHDFKINGKRTPLIKPGRSATLRVVFSKKGRYGYLCTVPGHAAAGMKGVLAAGTGAPPPTMTTTTTTTHPGPGGTVQVSMFEYGFTLSPSTVPRAT
jgi:uncharacterized cupredoxin-like copper-binding protein